MNAFQLLQKIKRERATNCSLGGSEWTPGKASSLGGGAVLEQVPRQVGSPTPEVTQTEPNKNMSANTSWTRYLQDTGFLKCREPEKVILITVDIQWKINPRAGQQQEQQRRTGGGQCGWTQNGR